MRTKRRIRVTVDADVVAAARDAASRGEVTSVSEWVNDALRIKVQHDRRLHALSLFVTNYESEHGAITARDIDAAVRRAGARAVVVRRGRA